MMMGPLDYRGKRFTEVEKIGKKESNQLCFVVVAETRMEFIQFIPISDSSFLGMPPISRATYREIFDAQKRARVTDRATSKDAMRSSLTRCKRPGQLPTRIVLNCWLTSLLQALR